MNGPRSAILAANHIIARPIVSIEFFRWLYRRPIQQQPPAYHTANEVKWSASSTELTCTFRVRCLHRNIPGHQIAEDLQPRCFTSPPRSTSLARWELSD
eukprot:6208151-Pleurochrysis_carterae.AAC.2